MIIFQTTISYVSLQKFCNTNVIIVEDVYLKFAQITHLFKHKVTHISGIHSSAKTHNAIQDWRCLFADWRLALPFCLSAPAAFASRAEVPAAPSAAAAPRGSGGLRVPAGGEFLLRWDYGKDEEFPRSSRILPKSPDPNFATPKNPENLNI